MPPSAIRASVIETISSALLSPRRAWRRRHRPDRSRAETSARRRSRRQSGSKARASAAKASCGASEGSAAFSRRRLRIGERQRGLQSLVLLHDRTSLLAIRRGDTRQQIREAGEPVARGLREIGAAEERLLRRREKHRQRPAAAPLREHRVRGLIDLIEVRPLLAVDLDVDEELVHQPLPPARPRRIRAPSRGTSDRPSNRSRAGSACLRAARARAPHRPRDTSRRGCSACCSR